MRPLITCPEGLGNRVAAIANALTWHARIDFAWETNEHCPLQHEEVFPTGVAGVHFVQGEGTEVCLMGGVPAMDWSACRCHHHASLSYRRVMASMGPQAWPEPPAVAIVARFHRVQRFDLPRLAMAAGRAAFDESEPRRRVFVLADQHREGIAILLRRHWNVEPVQASAPELQSDLDRTADDTCLFLRDWRTALSARRIIALDGPTSLLHPARAAGASIAYA